MDTSTVVMMAAAVITLAVVYFKSPEAASKGLNATGSLILEITPRMIAAFLLAGLVSAVLVFLQHPTAMTALLLVIAIWCFCRFYYFAFYVIEHYVDPSFKFSGLWDFAVYFFRGGRR